MRCAGDEPARIGKQVQILRELVTVIKECPETYVTEPRLGRLPAALIYQPGDLPVVSVHAYAAKVCAMPRVIGSTFLMHAVAARLPCAFCVRLAEWQWRFFVFFICMIF